MSNLNDAVARMKALYSYGTVNENNNKQSNYTLEFTKKAADGKYYGIVKECNHYYIKQSNEGKQNLAESYEYIGGYMNKRNYQYDSYANALKNLELKLSSINEAHDAKVDITTLDPYKKENLVIEATDKMKDEIARQRQIMYNAAMIMNESADYAVKGGSACSTKQPEAETGAKGDKPEGAKDANAEPEYKGSHIELDKKAVPFKENPTKVNEECDSKSCDTDFDEGMNKGEEPANIGWDMDGQKKVNEEDEKEWGSEGLPADSQAGVGSPDGHLMEDDEDDVDDVDVEDVEDEDFDDEDIFADDEGEEEVEDVVADDEGDTVADVEEPVVDADVEADVETPAVDETDPESVKAEIDRLINVLMDMEGSSDSEIIDEPVDVQDGLDAEPVEDEPVEDEPLDDEDDDKFAFESKKRVMKNIVESVVKDFKKTLKEEELHVFGDHPGYRKKPMTLPPTGEDKNEHGEDINDESVHNEEPFGKKIGDSAPFDELVQAVTADVMYQLTHGEAFSGKKKVK